MTRPERPDLAGLMMTDKYGGSWYRDDPERPRSPTGHLPIPKDRLLVVDQVERHIIRAERSALVEENDSRSSGTFRRAATSKPFSIS
jgi:hypothetical protein